MKKHLAFILLLILTFNNSFAKEGKKYYTPKLLENENDDYMKYSVAMYFAGKDPIYKQYSSNPVYKISAILTDDFEYAGPPDEFSYGDDIPNWYKHIYILEFVCLKAKTLPNIIPTSKETIDIDMIRKNMFLGERDPNCDCSKYPFTSKAEKFEEYKDDPCVGWKKYTKEEWELMQKPIIERQNNINKLLKSLGWI